MVNHVKAAIGKQSLDLRFNTFGGRGSSRHRSSTLASLPSCLAHRSAQATTSTCIFNFNLIISGEDRLIPLQPLVAVPTPFLALALSRAAEYG